MTRPKAERTQAPRPIKAIGRRTFLAKSTMTAALIAAQAAFRSPDSTPAAPSANPSSPIPADPTRVPGAAPTPYGSRSPFEQARRRPTSSHSLAPLQDLHGMLTPSALHFERHHNGVPRIDPARHRLLVHGLVDRPLLFTMEDLRRFPSVSRLAFIECSGNSAGEWKGPNGRSPQDTHGLLSTSEWTGVPLAAVLREAGIKPDAAWLLAEGGDAAAMTRSLPLADAMKEALLCYGQNGEALRPEQGYPLRLLLPGWEGNVCIKWLRRLKLGTGPFMTREETSHYTDLMPDGTARQFTLVMDAKSVILAPSGGQRLTPGFVEIQGFAWSGRGRITRVEVSTDGGRGWADARLQDPILPKCVTVFRAAWQWTGGEAVLQSRATDETGYVQPSRSALLAIRGTDSYYHYNAVQSWLVGTDGHVSNIHV